MRIRRIPIFPSLLLPSLLLPALLFTAVPRTARATDVTFSYAPSAGEEVKSVSVRGSFNSWGEATMTKGDDGTWSVTIPLYPGEYTYKYFVNGQWPKDMEIDHGGEPIDPDAEDFVDDGYGGQNAVRTVGGSAVKKQDRSGLKEAPPIEDGMVRIHYFRPKGDFDGWGLHVWGDTDEKVEWSSPLPVTGEDPYGAWWDVHATEEAKEIGFIVHKGDTKDPGPDMFLRPAERGREIWLVSGSAEIFTAPPDVASLALGNLKEMEGHWLTRNLIAWKAPRQEGYRYRLHFAPDGGLGLSDEGVTGGVWFDLTPDEAGIPPEVRERFPHIRGKAFRVPPKVVDRAGSLLTGQIAVSAVDGDGNLVDATGVQIPGVLDDLYTYEGPLGVAWNAGIPSFHLWAPTAKKVRLLLFDNSSSMKELAVVEMKKGRGVWSAENVPASKGMQYLYEVTVFVPAEGRVMVNRVTDPYSRGLTTNSVRSLLVNLADPALIPEGWGDSSKPALAAPEDIVLYELHVRDFSASDVSVPEEFRGTFKAFTVESNGTRHLRSLAGAGLTHVHLLPTFDIATVEEDHSKWSDPGDLAPFAPDSDEQQKRVTAASGGDGYNWGYDPFHYGVPEGSYSTDPDGTARILEFREMVLALSRMGLRTVMDVVYNHTNADGQSARSVLDRIVPGYYHRLNGKGRTETSTCCPNTATEHAMMERLMVDDLVHWARDYHIDGFRFDLMGHHMKRNIEKARDALHALTLEDDGVDGGAIYLYGEGWDFGEVAGGARGMNATQWNMAGAGVGTFNDRMRDAVRGGSPFSDRRERGFATGGAQEWGGKQADLADRVRFGLAGNLAGYRLVDHTGNEVAGRDYSGVGYASRPSETISYVSAHDNETFYDKIAWAAPRGLPAEERARMQQTAIAVTTLGQGIPFFHAGVEMLRSKSMDADSYNSGDWFNRLDFSYETNNFGVGLPPAEKNRDRWDLIRPILADGSAKPSKALIEKTVTYFQEMLQIRKSSHLFRLHSLEDVQMCLRFHNTGPDQQSGLIVMSLDGGEGPEALDPNYRRIVVLFNSSDNERCFADGTFTGGAFELHPVQVTSVDERLSGARFDTGKGEFCVPARTTAVFIEPR